MFIYLLLLLFYLFILLTALTLLVWHSARCCVFTHFQWCCYAGVFGYCSSLQPWILSCLPFLYTRTSLLWKYMMLLEYNPTLNVSSSRFMNICLFVYVGLLRCLRREFRGYNQMVCRFGITRILALKWYTAWQCKWNRGLSKRDCLSKYGRPQTC